MVFSKRNKLTEIIDKARELFSEEKLESISKIINKYPINFTGLDINYNDFYNTTKETTKTDKEPVIKYVPQPRFNSIHTRIPLNDTNIASLFYGKIAFQKYDHTIRGLKEYF